MKNYFEIIQNSYKDYFNYLISEIRNFHFENYFYALIVISLVVFVLEILFPWRKNQPIIRKGFWQDLFYLFFNFFLLNLIVLIALSNVTEHIFIDFLAVFNINLNSLQLIELNQFPKIISLSLFFIITDFIQWLTHQMLHKFPLLWKIHQVHHSVTQMGFAAHFRYHFLEPVIYKSILYIPIALIGGFTVNDVFIVHFITITIGHLNHANLGFDYGFLKYVINNPKMHIWHHSKILPNKNGINFGISLSLWDYIFKTNYIPKNGRDIELGFENVENYPSSFILQQKNPFKKTK